MGKGKGETMWGRDLAHPEIFGVAPLCQTSSWRGGEGKGEGRGTRRKKRDRKEENGRGGKLEQGRRLTKASPVWVHI